METLPGVNVALPLLNIATYTNAFGFYSLSLPNADSMHLVFSCAGYRQQFLSIPGEMNAELNISLAPEQDVMKEVVIEGRQSLESARPQMSTIQIPVAQMKDLPGLLGEKDMMKVLQLMPGVQKGREGNSGLYVRGGRGSNC